MFSDNQKISGRQITRLLIYDMLGITTLLVPQQLARLIGRDGVFAILLAVIPAFLVIYLMEQVLDRTKEKNTVSRHRTQHRISKYAVAAFCAAEGVLVAGFALFTCGNLIMHHLLEGESYNLVILVLTLLGGYGIWQGIEGRARVYELLFWVLMIPLCLMLILAAKDVNTAYWTPVFTHSVWQIICAAGLVFVYYMLVTAVLLLSPYMKKREETWYCCRKSIVVIAGMNAVIYLVTLGIFGEHALAEMKYPVITLMSMIKLPGGFFERQDAFMVAIWFFTLYALMNTGMFYAKDMIKRFAPKGREGIRIIAVMVLTYLVSFIFYRCAFAGQVFWMIQKYIAVPLVIMLLLFIRTRRGENENT